MTTNNCLIPLMTPGLGFEPGPPILVATLAAPKKLLASYDKSCVLLTLKGGNVYYLNKLRYFCCYVHVYELSILSNALCCLNFAGFDEPEERFVLTIYKVSGNGSIDGLRSNITITIAKHGHPNGVFRFQNTATRTFDEPASGVDQQSFTVERENGTQGTVNVSITSEAYS